MPKKDDAATVAAPERPRIRTDRDRLMSLVRAMNVAYESKGLPLFEANDSWDDATLTREIQARMGRDGVLPAMAGRMVVKE